MTSDRGSSVDSSFDESQLCPLTSLSDDSEAKSIQENNTLNVALEGLQTQPKSVFSSERKLEKANQDEVGHITKTDLNKKVVDISG